MRTCESCVHWRVDHQPDSIEEPYDPDTYEPMAMPFEVRRCRHPKLLFCERPLERDGFSVADGSEYFAAFYTGPDFGCVRHEPRSE